MSRSWTDSQKLAITVRDKTLLVSAAAGSGKTSVLTERIIRSLTDPQSDADLSRMLVVTFTRAAAAELKGRIAEALSSALAEAPDNHRLSEQLLKLGSAQISTIDSFFQKLVRANFEKLGLAATFRIADESEILPLAIEVLEGLIAEYYDRFSDASAQDRSIKTIQENRFAAALDHLLSNRSNGKLNDTLMEFHSCFSSYPEGIGLLKLSAQELRCEKNSDFLQTKYGALFTEYFTPLFEGYLNELDDFLYRMEYDPNMKQKCESLLTSDRNFCLLILEALQTKSYSAVQKQANGFYSGKFPSFPKADKPREASEYQTWRKQFRANGVNKLLSCFLYSPEEIARQMEKTADFCEIMYQFFLDYEDRLMAEKNSRGILEHNDVRTMVYRLLTDENGQASSFADSLSEQYDAVYIDEYQDVDAIQDRIFCLIGRNRRFMVGDIKQSIYGFRGSDPSIFSRYRRDLPLYGTEGAQDADGNSIFMSDNFRCDKPVISFTNQVCAFLFSACEKSIGYRTQDDLKPSKNPPENPPYGYPFPVQLAVFDRMDKKEKETDSEDEEGTNHQEAAWVGAEISRLLREGVLDNGNPITPSDIAILVRSKKHGKEVTRALKALSIPVASETSADYLHDPNLIDFLNLLRAIDNPYRDVPLSEYLLSPSGGFSLSELAEIRDAAGDTRALFDAMQIALLDQKLPHLTNKITSCLDWLKKWREQASVLSADRLIRLLLLDERWIELSSEPSLLMLYEQARLYQRTSWNALYGFLGHLDKLIDSEKISAAGFVKAENAVTIMTIHHSKGLEFPVVFLVSCGSQFNDMDARESLIYHRQAGAATKLYNPITAEHDNTALREAGVLAIKMEQHEENIRTLYVALTRARERLYVTGTLRGKYENILANASCVKRGNRSTILSCTSFLAWFLAAMCDAERQGIEFPCIFHHFSADEWDNGVVLTDEKTTTETAVNADNAVDQAYADIIRNHRNISYPLEVLHGLPTKAAASKLEPGLLDSFLDDTESEDSINQQIELMTSSKKTFETLLFEKQKITAAEIGTATHSFFEFCDYQNLLKNGFDAEKDRLIAQKFMKEETAELIDEEKIAMFCSSNLFQMILHAKHVYREQKFSLLVPMASLTENKEFAQKLQDHSLYVQGSIDLLLETEDGKLILVDYKTDRILPKEIENRALLRERMQAAHGTQLSCYSDAVEGLFGKKPDHVYLYLVSLGDVIEF